LSWQVKGNRMPATTNGRASIVPPIICLGLLFQASNLGHAGSGDPPPPARRPEAQAGSGGWVSVSYGDLVDTSQITQSGDTLGEVISQVVQRPHLRGSLQPFLAPFSALLSHVLDMNGPPAGRPYVEAERQFPPGQNSRPGQPSFGLGRSRSTSMGMRRPGYSFLGMTPWRTIDETMG